MTFATEADNRYLDIVTKIRDDIKREVKEYNERQYEIRENDRQDSK